MSERQPPGVLPRWALVQLLCAFLAMLPGSISMPLPVQIDQNLDPGSVDYQQTIDKLETHKAILLQLLQLQTIRDKLEHEETQTASTAPLTVVPQIDYGGSFRGDQKETAKLMMSIVSSEPESAAVEEEVEVGVNSAEIDAKDPLSKTFCEKNKAALQKQEKMASKEIEKAVSSLKAQMGGSAGGSKGASGGGSKGASGGGSKGASGGGSKRRRLLSVDQSLVELAGTTSEAAVMDLLLQVYRSDLSIRQSVQRVAALQRVAAMCGKNKLTFEPYEVDALKTAGIPEDKWDT